MDGGRLRPVLDRGGHLLELVVGREELRVVTEARECERDGGFGQTAVELVLLLIAEAEAGRRNRGQPVRADRLVAVLADPVAPGAQAGERGQDLGPFPSELGEEGQVPLPLERLGTEIGLVLPAGIELARALELAHDVELLVAETAEHLVEPGQLVLQSTPYRGIVWRPRRWGCVHDRSVRSGGELRQCRSTGAATGPSALRDHACDPYRHFEPCDQEVAMRALVYHGPGQKAWEEVPKPSIQADTDAVVRVDAVTICGTDLHILKGDVPAVTDGRILGHEAVGTVEEIGSGVKNVRVGDKVLVSCITACGACRFCREGSYGQCRGGGGWILGHKIDGTQAEYVRVPFADTSTYPAPAGVSDDELLMMADILPTGYEVGVLNGRVRPGDVVAVVGAGPIGLSAIMGSRLYSPAHIVAIDKADSRLDAAKQFGADVTVNNDREDPASVIAGLTGGLGADVAIEAVGVPATFELAAELIRPGGRVANIGVHGQPATLHLEDLWIRNVTITTGLVDTYSTPTLLKLTTARQIEAGRFVTHHFVLDQFMDAYDVFSRAADTKALKVVLTRV